jgi:asparagine synthase (glutamine-hydrolysing)
MISKKDKLVIGEDRLAGKPLFYHFKNGQLFFCSELYPLIKHIGMSIDILPESLIHYLINGYVHSPLTIIKDFKKLPPANYLVWGKNEITIHEYWNLSHETNQPKQPNEWLYEFERLFEESVRLLLRSDVSTGLLLSGGLDSNAVMAMMRRLGVDAEAFTVGLEDYYYIESKLARSAAREIGFKHKVFPSYSKLLDYMPKIVRHYGEPFFDKSAMPSFYLCEQVGEGLKVKNEEIPEPLKPSLVVQQTLNLCQ